MASNDVGAMLTGDDKLFLLAIAVLMMTYIAERVVAVINYWRPFQMRNTVRVGLWVLAVFLLAILIWRP